MPAPIAASTIVQQAFRAMGIGTLSSLADDDPRVTAASEQYQPAINMTLEANDWSFASTVANAPQISDTTTIAEDERYAFAFTLPADLLVLREVIDPSVAYRVDADGLLRSDTTGPLPIRYTKEITNEALLPATFQTAVSYQLALLMAPEHVKTARALDQLDAMFNRAFDRAARTDSRTASPKSYNQSYGGGDWLAEARR